MPLSPQEMEDDLLEMLEDLRPYGLAYYHPLVNGDAAKPEQVADWFQRFYVRDFGVGVARTYAKCPHTDARVFLAENLFEEEGQGDPERTHAALSLRLAKHFGADDQEIQRIHSQWMASPEIETYLARCADFDWLEDFAAFGLGQEFFAPPLFERIVDRLRMEFGVDDETLQFFIVHMYEDVDHSTRTMRMITRYADSDEAQQRVRDAVRSTVVGMAGLSGDAARPLPADIVEDLRKRARAAGQQIGPS